MNDRKVGSYRLVQRDGGCPSRERQQSVYRQSVYQIGSTQPAFSPSPATRTGHYTVQSDGFRRWRERHSRAADAARRRRSRARNSEPTLQALSFWESRAIVTSANLTSAALGRNHEFGMVSDDPNVIVACRSYFDDLWHKGGADLASHQLDAWDEIVRHHRAAGGGQTAKAH